MIIYNKRKHNSLSIIINHLILYIMMTIVNMYKVFLKLEKGVSRKPCKRVGINLKFSNAF
ncbi:hypothetical protein SAMN05443550_1212 [Pedobacter hartonius]|uniref:Uncharacterized protein n=1 Tax=Pedobacter hartonius TaxID=425514 RepID=A0A1H4HIE2_9SPHI|nr:hypothetical protein SAMN05443550_1212 [Pedobacter hartonius]